MAYLGNSPGVSSQRVVSTFTATSGQTTFTPISGYTLGYIDVYLNGIKLVDGDDYTAANGMTVVLASGAAVGDSVECVAFFPRGLSDGYLKSEADARYVGLTGDQTIAGVKTFSGSATIVNGNLGVGTSSVLGNSTLNAALGIVVRNQSTSMGYFQTYNANAGSNLKTWRFGGDGSGNFVLETVNDAYSSATNRFTIDSNGQFGFNTPSPAARMHVSDTMASSSTYQTELILQAQPSSGSTGTSSAGGVQLLFRGTTDGSVANSTLAALVGFVNTSAVNNAGGLLIRAQESAGTGLVDAARITSNGLIALRGANNLTSGTGIAFPATQSASSNANTLDDYEEGTWTPAVQSGAVTLGTINVATYVKVGRVVTVNAYCDVNSSGDSNNFVLGGLPFTVQSNGFSPAIVDIGTFGVTGAYARADGGTNQIAFLYPGASAGVSRQSVPGSKVVGYVIFTLTYHTAS